MPKRSWKRTLATLRRAVRDPRCPRCLQRHAEHPRQADFLLCLIGAETRRQRRHAQARLEAYERAELINVFLAGGKAAELTISSSFPEWADVQYRNIREALDIRVEQADGSRLATTAELAAGVWQ